MIGMRLEDIMKELGTPENKQWFAWAIAGVVIADGKMTVPEQKQMRELFLVHCSAEVSSAISETMKNNTKITLDAFRLEDRGLAAKIIKYLVIVAGIDSDIPHSEKEFLIEVGKLLGFSSSLIENVVAWRKRGIARQNEIVRDENDITLQLRSENPNY